MNPPLHPPSSPTGAANSANPPPALDVAADPDATGRLDPSKHVDIARSLDAAGRPASTGQLVASGHVDPGASLDAVLSPGTSGRVDATAHLDRTGSGRDALSTALPWILGAAIAYRLALTLVLAWWIHLAPPRPAPTPGYYHGIDRVTGILGELCVKWDSYWYLTVVERGYEHAPGEAGNTAFLPLYPMLIRAVAATGIAPAVAGVLVSTLCFLVLIWLACLYGRALYGPQAGAALALFLCVFPSSWLFQMVYTESLFSALLLAFLLLYRQGRYRWAAAAAFVVPMTRGVGLALLPAMAVDAALTWLRTRRFPREKLTPLLGAALGVLAVCAFYWSVTGRPFEFLLQTQNWDSQIRVGERTLSLFESIALNIGSCEVQAYLPFIAMYIVAALVLLVRRPDVGSLFVVASLAMTSTVSYHAQLRYLLPLLPVHAFFADLLCRRRLLLPVLLILAIIQLLVTRLYLDWFFVI